MPPFDIEVVAHALRLRLHGEVTIQDAAALQAALVPALAGGLPLVIDAGALTRLDTASLQVLLAAARAAPAARLAAPAPAWTDCFRRHALPDPTAQT